MKEISALTGFPYSTIRGQLIKGGMTLRGNKSVSANENLRQCFKNSAAPPYGFCYLNGRLEKDSREYPILQIIFKQWQMSRSATEIARHLNAKNYATRHQKKWKQPTVFYILERFESKAINMSDEGL